jgi:hypothetical protein
MSRKNCLTDDELVDLFLGEISRSRSAQLLSHVALCPICSLRFDILGLVREETEPKIAAFAESCPHSDPQAVLRQAARKKLADLAPKTPAGKDRRPRLRPRFTLRLAFGFLGILLVVATAGYLALDQFRPRAALRTSDLRLTLLEPIGRINRSPVAFRWTPVAHAEDYTLELIDDTLQQVFSSRTYLVTEHVIPAEVQARLVRGRTYLWSINALDADGNLLLSESGHFRLD